ncbi:MAG TPA: hypothetical protein VD926_13650 [Acidimicrobiales bacterium]|nr:hypothetical protein [Acidimicrobiales bacterium]
MSAEVTHFDPLLGAEGADAMLRLAEAYGTYRTYSEERTEQNYGDLPQRIDAAANYVRTGGRFGRRDEPVAALADRTNYFRETYAYGEDVRAPGIEPFLHHDGFLAAARALHGRDVIVPAIVYANLLLPGQELAVHTDVPEFRGANRLHLPQWLMVVMHHSGRFDEWRMPIATGVAYFGNAVEGAFAYYPDGVDGPAVALPVHHDTAVLLDTDTVFHGVDRVGTDGVAVPELGPAPELRFVGDGRWSLQAAAEEPVAYHWDDLRFSVSWKAYCFADEAERRAWAEHADDLTLDVILDRLEADLRDRGGLDGPRPAPREFATLLIRTYIRFPEAAPA